MEQAIELFLNGARFRKLFEKELTDVRKKYDLCKIDVQILQYLHKSGECNTSKDIVDMGLFTKGHVSQSLNRLYKKNMIHMIQDEHDRRCMHILLRDMAEQVVEDMEEVHQRISQIVFYGVTEEEKQGLLHLANKINANIMRVTDDLKR